jgi:hypothetical protein
MGLGEVLQQAAEKDIASVNKLNGLKYEEVVEDDKFYIRFSCTKFKEATIECEIPYTIDEEKRNYARMYFLSMVFNAAIHGLKRNRNKTKKRWK